MTNFEYSELNYLKDKNSEVQKIRNGIKYRLNIPKSDDKNFAEANIFWNGKNWIAMIYGTYKNPNGNSGGNFFDGPLSLNNEAVKLLCEFYKINIGNIDENKKNLIIETSPYFLNSKPVEKISKLEIVD